MQSNDEKINYILTEYSRQAYKANMNRHDQMRRVICWESCKKKHFGHKDQCNMYKRVYFVENSEHEISIQSQEKLLSLVQNPDLIIKRVKRKIVKDFEMGKKIDDCNRKYKHIKKKQERIISTRIIQEIIQSLCRFGAKPRTLKRTVRPLLKRKKQNNFVLFKYI